MGRVLAAEGRQRWLSASAEGWRTAELSAGADGPAEAGVPAETGGLAEAGDPAKAGREGVRRGVLAQPCE